MAEKLSVTETIGMWLAKADASDSEHEKELFYAKAQAVATRESIDLAVARRAVAKGQHREQPTHKHITLGKRGQRALSWYVELFSNIASANDLRITMSPYSTYVNLYGMPSDIEVAEAIYASTVTSMVQLADAYLKAGDYKKDVQWRDVKVRRENPNYGEWGWDGRAEPKYVYEWTQVKKPVSGMTARQNFYAGFCSRIGQRLMDAKRDAVAEVTKERDDLVASDAGEAVTAGPGTALVLKEKREEVDEYYRKSTGKLGTYRGSRSPVYSGTARAAGSAAASKASLGGSSTSLPGQRKALGS